MMMGGYGGGQVLGVELVDVVLVLLIIFMVVLPSVQEGKTIEMVDVKVADENKGENEKDPLMLTLDGDGKYHLGEEAMSRQAALQELRKLHAQDPRQRLILRIDASRPYVDVRELLAELRESDFKATALAVGTHKEWKEEA